MLTLTFTLTASATLMLTLILTLTLTLTPLDFFWVDFRFQAPPQLAAMWFPPRQRATATAIAWSSQAVGVSIGFYLAPVLVYGNFDIYYYYSSEGRSFAT